MEEKVTRINVVKRFFSEGSTKPVTTPEFMEFWKVCSEAERQEFAESAAKRLGVVLSTQ